MSSPVPVPQRDHLANYPPEIGDALVHYEQRTVWKQPVRVASAASIANLSSVTVANFDGTGQGVTLVAGDRVLVKNNASLDGVEGTAAKRQGIYAVGTVTTGTAPLTRDTDASASDMVTCGMTTTVMEGTYAGQDFVLTTANPITLDTTALAFAQPLSTSLNGVTVPGSPAIGQSLLATGTAAAVWSAQSPLVRSARGVVTTNVASLAAFAAVAGGTPSDGVTYIAGDRVLLAAQTTVTQNGIYQVGTVAAGTAPLTRVADMPTGAVIVNGTLVEISEGTQWNGTQWKSYATTTGGAVIGTNDPTFYPRRYSFITTAMSGTPGIKAITTAWIFSAVTSLAKPVVKVAGTQGFLSVGTLTAGPGTGSFTVTSTANETSTLYIEITN